MRAKVIVSLGAVAGVAVLSAGGFASTFYTYAAGSNISGAHAGLFKAPMAIVRQAQFQEEGLDIFRRYPEEKRHSLPCHHRSVEIRIGPGEEYLLTKIAMAEAEGEDTKGKALVMRVVLNRVQTEGFPDTVQGVIYQPGQFSPVGNGRFYKVEPDNDCWEALSMIKQGAWDDSQGATYFESKSKSAWHEKNLEFLFRHGSHYFYKEKECADE